MATMIDELTGTKAAAPQHDYRRVTFRRDQTQKVRLFFSSPRSAQGFTTRTARVSRTQEGTLRGKGWTQHIAEPKDVGSTSVGPLESVLKLHDDNGELVANVSIATEISIVELLARVTKQRNDNSISAGEASDLLFPFLFEGPIYQRREVFAAMEKFSTPDAILDTALRIYRLNGYEGYLNEAASLLSSFSLQAWPSIRKWANLGGSGTESLVETMLSLKGVSDSEYLGALNDLLTKGDHNTRSRVLGAIHLIPERLQRDALIQMAHSGDSADPTRSEAKDRLAENPA